jgi:hypothetical protein
VAKRKSPATDTEPPSVFELCQYCKVGGQVGAQVLPYTFAKGDLRWLHREPCMGLAWNAWKAANEVQAQTETITITL